MPPLWPVSGNRGSARSLLYVLWVGFHCEPLRNATRAAPRGRCDLQPSGDSMKRVAWKTMVTGENHIEISVPATAARSRDQPDTGSNLTATVLSRCQNLQDNEQMV